MMKQSAPALLLVSLLFALPWLIIWTATLGEVQLSASGGLPPLAGIPAMLIITAVGAAGWFRSLRCRRTGCFALHAFVVTGALISVSVRGGTYLHQDWFSGVFQYLMVLPPLVLIRLYSDVSRGESRFATRTTALLFSRIGILISILYAQWIFMMGYAIATRAEPRIQEALLYNAYNALLAFITVWASWRLRLLSSHTLRISPDQMQFDNRDITALAGSKKTALLHAFASAPQRCLRCSDIQRLLGTSASQDDTSCSDCSPRYNKAAMCGRYRTTYNAVLELKKLLEFMEIGTIKTPENRMHILEEGWRLVLFENTRLITSSGR